MLSVNTPFTDNTTALSYVKKRGDVFHCSHLGSATPPPVGGIVRFDSGSSVYRRVPECSGRLPEPSSAGPWFRVDLGSGGRGRVGRAVASNRRPFRHSPQLPTPGLLLAPQRPHGSRHGHVSPGVGWPTGICVSPFRSHSPGHQQAEVVQGDLSNANCSNLASKGMVSGALESCGGSSVAPSFMSRLTQTAPLSSPAPEPPRAEPSCMVIIQRFARNLGLSCCVANQLSLCRYQSSRHLYQHRWECYQSWCASRGHSVSSPTIAKTADFLLFLCAEKHFSVSLHFGLRI